MSNTNKPSEQTQSSFKVDHDASGVNEMPSVTRLLNRKKLGLSAPKNKKNDEPSLYGPASTNPPFTPAEPGGPVLETLSPSVPSPEPSAQFGAILLEPAASAPEPAFKGPSGEAPLEIALSDGPTSVPIESSQPPSSAYSPGIDLMPPATVEISLAPTAEPTPPSHSTPSPAAVVRANTRAAPRRPATPTPHLTLWDTATLLGGTDPLGTGILELTKLGAPSALFLAIQSVQGKVIFGATAAYAPGTRQTVWAGIRLNPEHFPELWGKLLTDGFAEFAPPGSGTDVGSLRNLARGAFAARAEEWLTFFRAGTPASCRGILVVVSNQSLRVQAASAMRHISTPVVMKKAA